MDIEGQEMDNPGGMTPAAMELYSDELEQETNSGGQTEGPENEPEEGAGESGSTEEEEGQPEGDNQTAEGGEDLDFEEPEIPEDWPEDVKAAFQEKLQQVQKQWQAAYTKKRQAETSEIKELRAQLEELSQAIKGEGETSGKSEETDPLAAELEALRQEDPDSAEITERLLRVTREATKQEVLREVQKIIGPIMEQYNQLQLVTTMKKAEESLGLEEGFLDNQIDDLNARVQKALNDPAYFMQLVAADIAREKANGQKKTAKTRTTNPAPSARSPRKSAPSKTGPIDWDAELAKIDPDDSEGLRRLAERRLAYERARR